MSNSDFDWLQTNLARDVGILSKAREAAFKLVEEGSLSNPKFGRVREVLSTRWSGKLGFAEIS